MTEQIAVNLGEQARRAGDVLDHRKLDRATIPEPSNLFLDEDQRIIGIEHQRRWLTERSEVRLADGRCRVDRFGPRLEVRREPAPQVVDPVAREDPALRGVSEVTLAPE